MSLAKEITTILNEEISPIYKAHTILNDHGWSHTPSGYVNSKFPGERIRVGSQIIVHSFDKPKVDKGILHKEFPNYIDKLHNMQPFEYVNRGKWLEK